ncbi:hypothetical protein K523DRAFT_160555 [Schizophyllum commune Tattone D]|nr:hypothetical protein K523DRAFT_160555 [Schizophyllum commune Tattone D]
MPSPLHIPEICLTICQECRQRDLCRLALVSKYWNAIANVLLWESIPGVVCLLRLMPHDAWEILDQKPPGVYFLQYRRVFKFRRPLTPEDWHPVLERASYVRVLDQTALGRRRVSYFHDVIDAIAACPPGQRLCPELRKLDMRLSAFFSRTSQISDIILTPTLTSLTITLDADCTVPQDCSMFAASCPNLRTLVIREHGNTQYTEAVMTAFHLHSHLEHVSLHTYSPSTALGVVAHLPSLTKLGLQSLSRPPSELNIAHHTGLFTSLTSLFLEACASGTVCAMMRAWQWRPIESLELEAVPYKSPDDLRHIMQHIHDHCEPTALQKLVITTHNPFEIAGARPVLLRDFDPLPVLPNLAHVDISVPFVDMLTDSDWAQIVPRMPALEVFILRPDEDGTGFHDEEARTSTLEPLLYFARGCRRLRELSIPLGRVLVPPNFSAEREPPQTALTSLDIQWATAANDIDAIVAFLAAVFPSLHKLETSCCWTRHDALDEDYGEPWSSLKKAFSDDWRRRNPKVRPSRRHVGTIEDSIMDI